LSEIGENFSDNGTTTVKAVAAGIINGATGKGEVNVLVVVLV
jgi:hypothetical protein